MSGEQFPAEEVFKHFVVPGPPYDPRTYLMTRDAHFESLISQGLIDRVDDEIAHGVTARANPRVRVHGKYVGDVTFVIHVVESDPPPTFEPRHMPKVGIALLRDGMYSLRLPMDNLMLVDYLTGHNGYTPGDLRFAGECSAAWMQITISRRLWRAEFRRRRGRPEGRGSRFRGAKDFRQTVITDLCNLRRRDRADTQLELARLWYQRDTDPTAEPDSLVAQIKRYCKRCKSPWDDLVEEARRG